MTYKQVKPTDQNMDEKRTFSESKFLAPSADSSNCLPEPWPRSSWLATCSSNARLSQALYRSMSSGWTNVSSSSKNEHTHISQNLSWMATWPTGSFRGQNILKRSIWTRGETSKQGTYVQRVRHSWNQLIHVSRSSSQELILSLDFCLC